MEIIETGIEGLLIIKPKIFGDARGYFCETYNKKRYQDAGIMQDFCQDNLSKSTYGVIRGLHFQLNPESQSKLVSVVEGRVYDVAVDIRVGSPTYGKWYGVELDADSKTQFLIPRGFAHGFLTLTDNVTFVYEVDNFYSKEHDAGILWNDPEIDVDWGLDCEPILSDKDKNAPIFKDSKVDF